MIPSRLASWLRDQWRWLVVCLLASQLTLSTVYSVVTPIWEGPDELGHYHHVRFLVQNLSLPGPEDSTTPLDQLTHPPLHYALAAMLTSWVDTSDALEPVTNPFAPTGTMEGGANRFLHSDAESFPWQGTVLAVHMARFVSVIVGMLGVLVTYQLGRLLLPDRPEIALGAMAINAFSPSYIFMSGVINNDITVSLFSALTLLFSTRLVMQSPRMRDLLALGLFTGLAFLSKYNALALIPIVVVSASLAIARLLRGRRSLVVSLGGAALLLLSAAAVSSWWFLRSVALFGTPTTRSAKILTQFLEDIRDPLVGLGRVDWNLLPEGLEYFYRSFWATFGWGNVSASTWVYQVLGLLCLAGIAGFVLFLLGKAPRSVKTAALLLLLAFVLFSLQAIYRALIVGDPVLRGRYALPAISAISVLLSLGVVHLTPRRLGRLPILLAGLTMLLLGLIAPFRYIMPVYARPPILSAEEALRVPNPLALNFGDKIELVGYELGVDRATAGQFVPVTLYWRALTAVEQNYTVGLSLFGTDGKPYGQLAAYPGHGNYPTSLWQEGEIIEDAYQVRLRQRFPAPGLARAYVALYTYPDEEYLLLLDSQGAPVDRAAVLGPFPVQLSRSPEYQLENRLECGFGDQAALVGHEFDAGLFDTGYGCLTLYWETLAEIPEDYTVFVHVVDEQGKTVAQSDSPPRGGAYPTSYWQEGETIPDEHCLGFPSDVIPGSYRVFAGMYLLETMQRVPVFDASGGRVRDDQCSILEWQTSSRSTRLFLPLASR